MGKGPAQLGNLLSLLRGRIPGQLIIQMTDRCNGRCPQCGMRASNKFERTSLSTDDMKRMIDAAAEKGVQFLSFTGGEPLLMLDELTTLIRHAGRAGIPYIRTGTNGFFLRDPHEPDFESRVMNVVDALAGTPLRNLWISVDSAVPEVHEQMRGFEGIVKGMEKAIPMFHDAGIYPSANLGLNRNTGGDATASLEPGDFPDEQAYLRAFRIAFRQGLERFYRFVGNLGYTMVNTCYPMSLDEPKDDGGLAAVYTATAADRVVRFTDAERALIFRSLLDVVPAFRPSIRIFSPLSSVYALYQQYSGGSLKPMPCRGGIDFFFISCADGNTYPCGYRGQENMGTFWDLDLSKVDCSDECTQCDWECFRDPSETVGPLLLALRQPQAAWKRLRSNAEYRRLWLSDLRYQRACGYFDGRVTPDMSKLAAFAGKRYTGVKTAGEIRQTT